MANWGYGGNLPLHNSSMSRFSTGSPEPEILRSRPTSQLPVLPLSGPRSQAHSDDTIGILPSNGVMQGPSQYNPAALLNPRGGYQETRHQQRPQHMATSQPPKDFQFHFDSPSTSHAHQVQIQQVDSTNGAGMGSMVERMHNVADRSQVQPVKRQKIQESDQGREGRNNSGFNVLGNYMREQRKIGQKDEGRSSIVNLEGVFVNVYIAIKG